MKNSQTENQYKNHIKKLNKNLNRNFTPLWLFVSAAALEACVEGSGTVSLPKVISIPYSAYQQEITKLFLEGNPNSIEDGLNDGFVIIQEQLGGAQEIAVTISGVIQTEQVYFQIGMAPANSQGQTYSQLIAQNQEDTIQYSKVTDGTMLLNAVQYTYLNSLQLVIANEQFNADVEITITATVSYSGSNTEQPIVQQIHKAVYKITPNEQPELNMIGEQQITQIDEGFIGEQMSVAEYQVTDQDHILTSFGEENFILYYLKRDNSLEEIVGDRDKFKIVRDGTNGNVEVVINQHTVLDYDDNSNDGGRLYVDSDGTKYYKLLLAAFDDISIQYKQNAQGEPQYDPVLQQLSFLKDQSSITRIIEAEGIEELSITVNDVADSSTGIVPLPHGGQGDVRMLFLRGNPYDGTPNPETDGFANIDANNRGDVIKVTFSNLPEASLARVGIVLPTDPTDSPTIDPIDATKIILPQNPAIYSPSALYDAATMLDTFAVDELNSRYLQEGETIFLTKEQYDYLDTLYLSVLQNTADALNSVVVEIEKLTVAADGTYNAGENDIIVVQPDFADAIPVLTRDTTLADDVDAADDNGNADFDEAITLDEALIAQYNSNDPDGQTGSLQYRLFYKKSDGMLIEIGDNDPYFYLLSEPYRGQANVDDVVSVYVRQGVIFDYESDSDTNLIITQQGEKYYDLSLVVFDSRTTASIPYINSNQGSIEPQSRQELRIEINNVNEQPVLSTPHQALDGIVKVKTVDDEVSVSLADLLRDFSDPDGIADITDVILTSIPVGVEISYYSIADGAERRLSYSETVELNIADIGVASGATEENVFFEFGTNVVGGSHSVEVSVKDRAGRQSVDHKALGLVIDELPEAVFVSGLQGAADGEVTIEEFTYLTAATYENDISNGGLVIAQYRITDPIDSFADGGLQVKLYAKYPSHSMPSEIRFTQLGADFPPPFPGFNIRRVEDSEDLVEVFLKFGPDEFSYWDYEIPYQYQQAPGQGVNYEKFFELLVVPTDPNNREVDAATIGQENILKVVITDVTTAFNPAVDALDENDATSDVIDISYSEDSTSLDIALIDAASEYPNMFSYSLETVRNSGNNLPFNSASSGMRDATDFIKIDPTTGQLSFKPMSELPVGSKRTVDYENPYYNSGSIDPLDIVAANYYALRVKVEELDGNNNVVTTLTKDVRVHVTDANEPPSLKQAGMDLVALPEHITGQIRHGGSIEISLTELKDLFEDSDTSSDYNVIEKLYFDLPDGATVSYKNSDGITHSVIDTDGRVANSAAEGVYDFATDATLLIYYFAFDSNTLAPYPNALAPDTEYSIRYKVFDNAGLSSSDEGVITFSIAHAGFRKSASLASPSDNPFAGFGGASDKIAAMSLEDIDGDGDMDLVTAQENKQFKYYENNGDNSPVFTERSGTDNPFAALAAVNGDAVLSTQLFDIDQDGDLDFIYVASETSGVAGSGGVYYHENTGSQTGAIFDTTAKEIKLRTSEGDYDSINGVFYIDFSDVSIENGEVGGVKLLLSDLRAIHSPIYYYDVSYDNSESAFVISTLSTATGTFLSIVDSNPRPVFAYIDDDELPDLVYGTSTGELRYYKNTGLTNNAGEVIYEMPSDAADNPFNGIDIDSNAAPVFADVDGDGDDDLSIVDVDDGIIHYVENLWVDAA